MNTYEHVLGFALDHPWAITRPMLRVVAGILARRVAGEATDRAEIELALVNRKNLPQPTAGATAIIPMYGVIAPRMNLLSEMSGGTTFETLSAQLRSALANKAVSAIVFDVDSPGGSAAGAREFAHEVRQARTQKPIIAQAQYTMASAAYWGLAGATEIVAAPSAKVGSIGIYTSHDDLSDALAKLGVKRTYIAAGKGKTYGNETEPLSVEAAGRLQAMVDEAYEQFVDDVVQGRGTGAKADQIRTQWQALVYSGADALALGMIDRVATLDETLARLDTAAPADKRRPAAAAHTPTPSTGDTTQEPLAATVQDRRAEADLERQVLELQQPL